MNLVNKINKQAKYCLQNYKHFSCEMCPVRLLALSLTNKDPAEIRTCMYLTSICRVVNDVRPNSSKKEERFVNII